MIMSKTTILFAYLAFGALLTQLVMELVTNLGYPKLAMVYALIYLGWGVCMCYMGILKRKRVPRRYRKIRRQWIQGQYGRIKGKRQWISGHFRYFGEGIR